MPPRRRLLTKRSARAHEIMRANARLERRRASLRSLNELVAALDLPLPTVGVRRSVDSLLLKRILRALARRCTEGPSAEQFESAVRKWVSGGGTLPDGVTLLEPGQGVMAGHDDSPEVPRHKVLQFGFRLQSSAFMMTYHNDTFNLDTWPPFRRFIESLSKKHGARAWSACLEANAEGPATEVHAQKFHTHAYLIWTDGIGLRLRDIEPLRFLGKQPRMDVCTARGPNVAGMATRAALHGLWYVAVMKAGTMQAATNHTAWRDYTPSVRWLTGLWDAHKLSHAAFLDLSAQFRTGHAKRKRDVEDVMRQEQSSSVVQHVLDEQTALDQESPLEELRAFPDVARFIEGFQRHRRRRPILALVGGTNSGKSLMAHRVLKQVGETLGLDRFVEVTVEGDTVLDFSAFDHRVHAGVLLDGLGDVYTLWCHREVLQGRPKACRGGRSATMVYSYPYTLARRAIVVTLDLTAKNLHMLSTNHWLRDEKNVICVRLDAPAWQTDDLPQVAPPRRETMAARSVDELAQFVAGQDAAALADMLRSQSVSGGDFVSFEAHEDLTAELKITPFAAKKLIRLRGLFLSPS